MQLMTNLPIRFDFGLGRIKSVLIELPLSGLLIFWPFSEKTSVSGAEPCAKFKVNLHGLRWHPEQSAFDSAHGRTERAPDDAAASWQLHPLLGLNALQPYWLITCRGIQPQIRRWFDHSAHLLTRNDTLSDQLIEYSRCVSIGRVVCLSVDRYLRNLVALPSSAAWHLSGTLTGRLAALVSVVLSANGWFWFDCLVARCWLEPHFHLLRWLLVFRRRPSILAHVYLCACIGLASLTAAFTLSPLAACSWREIEPGRG